MAFNTVGIQDNLPVLPVHVLQIIQSLTEFGQTYSAEDFFREGRTNFGAAEFTSSAHVEMHSYNGADPLVVYSGQYNDTEVFSIDVNGTTSVTSLTGSDATLTTLAVANEAVINSAITTATVNTATIQTATVSGLSATNGVITTLNSTVGAIATFTASNAQVTNTANIATLSASLANINTIGSQLLTATNAVVSDLTVTSASISALSAANTNITNNLAVSNSVSIGNDLTVTGDTTVVGYVSASGALSSGQATIDYTNTDYVNANGNNSHIKLNNSSATGQTSISSVINGKLAGKLRNDYVGNINYVASGSGNHYFFTQGDYPSGNVRLAISSSGRVGIGTTTPTATLDVIGNVKAVSFAGSFSGSFTGSIATASYVENAQTASYVSLTAGPGITVNGLEITASVRTVNGIGPVDGNIPVSLAGVLTGTSASLATSSSGAITGSISNGALWVVSGDGTPANNGDAYIYNSGSVGQWLTVAPLDTAAGDARYLLLSGLNAMAGDLDLDGNDIIDGGIFYGTATTASFVTGSGVFGPYGANSVVSASQAVSSSQATSASFAISASWAPQAAVNTTSFITTGSISTTQTVTGSLRVTGSGLTVTGSIITTQLIASIGGTVGLGLAGRYIYPSWTSVDFSVGTNKAGFAHIRPANTGIATLTAGPTTYYWSDINIGPDVTNKAGSIKIATDTGNTSPSSTITYTLVSHGNNTTDNNNTWKTANGRDHALTVSGSMLARDSVSLGTNIANSHIITGSINMTGSFTLNGTNLNTLVSPIQSVTVNLTQSDILNLGSGIQLIALPGINKLIVVHRVVLMYKFNTQQYINTTGTRLYQGATAISNNLEILQYPSSAVISFSPSDTTATLASSLANQPLQLFNNIGNPSGGDGTMKVVVYYEIVDLP